MEEYGLILRISAVVTTGKYHNAASKNMLPFIIMFLLMFGIRIFPPEDVYLIFQKCDFSFYLSLIWVVIELTGGGIIPYMLQQYMHGNLEFVESRCCNCVKTCSSPRCPLFLHALSFECTSKLCITFLNQFLVYFHILKMHNTI